jgi:hypothetical protein
VKLLKGKRLKESVPSSGTAGSKGLVHSAVSWQSAAVRLVTEWLWNVGATSVAKLKLQL